MPDVYSPEIAADICKRLADGESLRSICRDPVMPARATVRDWVINDRHGFAAQYAHARDLGLDEMADDVVTIADTPVVGIKTKTSALGTETTEGDMIEHRRLQVDTRKWYLSKLAPKRYGDKLELAGPDGQPLIANQQNDALSQLVIALLDRTRARVADDGSQRQSLLGAATGSTA